MDGVVWEKRQTFPRQHQKSILCNFVFFLVPIFWTYQNYAWCLCTFKFKILYTKFKAFKGARMRIYSLLEQKREVIIFVGWKKVLLLGLFHCSNLIYSLYLFFLGLWFVFKLFGSVSLLLQFFIVCIYSTQESKSILNQFSVRFLLFVFVIIFNFRWFLGFNVFFFFG